MLRIAIDATADMPLDWIEKYDLSILPIPIQIGGTTYYQGLVQPHRLQRSHRYLRASIEQGIRFLR